MKYDVILGLDPSLTGFGISDGDVTTSVATPSDRTLRERAGMIFHEICCAHAEAIAREQIGRGFIEKPRALWVVEAPLFSPKAASNAFDVGVLHSHIWDAADASDGEIEIIEIGNRTLKKFVTGSGASDKIKMALAVARKWKREFKNDNETDAYCLHRYGAAVAAGEIVHVAIAKRGQRARERAERKRARTS